MACCVAEYAAQRASGPHTGDADPDGRKGLDDRLEVLALFEAAFVSEDAALP